MRPRRALLGAALACLLVVPGCGGDEGSSADASKLLKRAFAAPISSAKINLEVKIEVDGIEELKDPIRVKLEGPYSSGAGKEVPSFDWEVGLSGGGQSLSAGLVSTGKNVFVSFQGTAYEAGEDGVKRFNSELAEAQRTGEEGGLSRFGIDPSTWLSDSKIEGTEKIADVETSHVTSRLDVGRMLDDLNKLVDRAQTSVPTPAPPKLTEEQQRQVQEVVEDPRFDVYVGKEDGKIRRLSTDLRLNVPEDARERARGLEGGTISFSIEFAEVGQKQQVKAPTSARPIAELARQLGGLGALAGGVGPQNGTPPPSGGGPDTSGGPSDGVGRSFEEYSQCLEKADPSKIEEIERCSDILR